MFLRKNSPKEEYCPKDTLARLQAIKTCGWLFVVVQSLSRVWLFVTPRTAACQTSLSFTISQSLLQLKSTESVMPSSHLILGHHLLLLPSIRPSIRVFSNKSSLTIRWPKYGSLIISLSNEYSGLISFMMDWFDLLAVKGTLKSCPAPQFKTINSSALSLFYGPALTSIHDDQKNYNFDHMDLCWESDVSAF